MKKFLSILTALTVSTIPISAFAADYTSDSAELRSIIEHYVSDDANGYIDKNINKDLQKIIIDTVNAVIDGETPPESEDKAVQKLINLVILAAQGGRESEVTELVRKNIEIGNTKDVLLASALLCTPYNGFPRTLNIMSAINSAIDEISEKSENKEFLIITMETGSFNINIDGVVQTIDATPIVSNSQLFLPVRALTEAIGGKLEWNAEAKSMTINYNSSEIKYTTESKLAYISDKEYIFDATPVIIDNHIMVPEKFISDNFGFVINWNEEEKSIAISKNSSNKNTDNKTIKENIKTINNIFEKGEVNPFSSVFTGKSYLSTLVPNEDIFNSPSFSNVTFEPCTRTDWHSHDGGQILLVTEGEGLYQEEGKQAVFMKPGDVIMAKPGVKHWHGASKDSWFAHIAISTNPNTSSVNWQEKVSDEEYNKAFDDAKKSDMHKNDTKHIFPVGELNPMSDVFTGISYLSTLVPTDDIFNCPFIANVTFEPCTRTDWHSHDGGQILLVTEGKGLYQEEGKEHVVMKPGDIIMAEPGVKHWHGAGKNGQFAHISVSTNPDNSKVNWQEKVSDEEYENAASSADK